PRDALGLPTADPRAGDSLCAATDLDRLLPRRDVDCLRDALGRRRRAPAPGHGNRPRGARARRAQPADRAGPGLPAAPGAHDRPDRDRSHPRARGARAARRAARRPRAVARDLAVVLRGSPAERTRTSATVGHHPMSLSRRQLFGLSGGVVAGVALGACGVALTAPGGSTGAVLPSEVPLPKPFTTDLP